jgi:hypothetical protein
MASKSALDQAEAGLPVSSESLVNTSKRPSRSVLLILSFLGAIFLWKQSLVSTVPHALTLPALTAQCPEQPLFHPSLREDITKTNIDQLFKSENFRDLAASRLSGAVQVPTVTYDGMDKLGKDPRWDVFYEFGSYLKATFPRLYGPSY